MNSALLLALLSAGSVLVSCGSRSPLDDLYEPGPTDASAPDTAKPFVDPCWQTDANPGECCSREGCGFMSGSGICATLMSVCPAACAPGFVCVGGSVMMHPVLGSCYADPTGQFYQVAFCASCELLPNGCS